jgi:threonyl-tRNA synthetase
MPERFDLKYIGADNAEHRPVVIHRAIIGTFERFIGLLTEHFAGAWPLWLAPVQVTLLPIADRHVDYAKSVRDQLVAAGFRVELDDRVEKIGYKIREAQLQKVPYMLVIGDKEVAEGTVAVRHRSGGDLGSRPTAGFLSAALDEVARKGLEWPGGGQANRLKPEARSRSLIRRTVSHTIARPAVMTAFGPMNASVSVKFA